VCCPVLCNYETKYGVKCLPRSEGCTLSSGEVVANGKDYVSKYDPCDTGTCMDGELVWIETDCAEHFGLPCEGGHYEEVPGQCCSKCVQGVYG
jgi:hypothetical protein